jgi:DNA-binding CsgD family transcriptional regulator
MPDDLAPEERAEIMVAYCNSAGDIEEHEVVIRVAHEAAAIYRAIGMPAKAIGVLGNEFGVWRREARPLSDRIAMANAMWAELESMPETRDVIEARADVTFSLTLNALDAHDLAGVRHETAKLRAYADELDDPELRLVADWKDGLADAMNGDVQVGLARVGAVAFEAAGNGWEGTGVTAFREASGVAAAALDYHAAQRWIGEGVRYADSIEQSHCAHLMRSTQALVSWAFADPGDAQRRARQSIVDKGCGRGTFTTRLALGYVALTRGELEVATTELEAALDFAMTSEEIELILPPLWGLAEVAIQAGHPQRAADLCREALDRSIAGAEKVLLTPFVVTGVRAAVQAGRPLDAAAWLADCTTQLGGITDTAGAALDHGRGLVALAEGTTGVARVALEAAVAGWDRHARAWEAAWARVDLAQCLVRSTRFADAVPVAVEARAAALRLESPVLTERAESILRMARGHVPDDEPWRPLTSREFEVARLIGEGMTNAEIADALDIATKTASSHVEHILAKLGASRRAEIATWASHVQTRSGASRAETTLAGRATARP